MTKKPSIGAQPNVSPQVINEEGPLAKKIIEQLIQKHTQVQFT